MWPTAEKTSALPGEWSFALYLFQVAIITVVTSHLTLSKGELALGGWLMLLFIAGCTVIAAVAHYAIEKPAERWLRARGPMDGTAPPPDQGAAGAELPGGRQPLAVGSP